MLIRRLFMLCLLAVGMFQLVVSVAAQTKPDGPVRKQLVGAWRLVNIETIRPNGEIIYPFYGKHPEGLIMYDQSGWMSVQIVSDPRPNLPKANSRDAFLASTPAEKIAAAEGYYAYCGTWTIDTSTSTVTHHVKQALYPGEKGEDFPRHFTLEGDHLTLIAKLHEMGEDHQRKLVWERVHADKP
jgi:Lipocalin-like domain